MFSETKRMTQFKNALPCSWPNADWIFQLRNRSVHPFLASRKRRLTDTTGQRRRRSTCTNHDLHVFGRNFDSVQVVMQSIKEEAQKFVRVLLLPPCTQHVLDDQPHFVVPRMLTI